MRIATLSKFTLIILSLLLTNPFSISANTEYSASTNAQGQQKRKTISGKVIGDDKQPLAGATVTIQGTPRGVTTDVDGTYTIEATSQETLVFSYIGYETSTIKIENQTVINITLKTKADELEQVTVVGFAKQKKESVIASVSTISPAELKVPTSNLTTALGGRIAGIISYQTSGEPGKDNANFFIRGVTTFGYKTDPLILIDNIESTSTDLARLSPYDIASFSIMKDATATAIYGARGANGVILVTTKEGKEGPATLDVRFENSISMPTKRVKTVDPITYMHKYNEAVVTRDPMRRKPYSQEKIVNTMLGANPNVYPAVDWYDELFNKFTNNQRANMSLGGGGKVARYYVSANFSNDNGVLKVDERNNYNKNINLKKIQLRTNVNLVLSPTTDLDFRITTNFDDYRGPLDGGDILYKKAMAANPTLFPQYYEPDEANIYTKHILYGNYGADAKYLNPYADMTKGYKNSSYSLTVAQMQVSQKLDFITKGLNIKVLGNFNRESYYEMHRSTKPFYYGVGYYDKYYDKYTLAQLNPDEGTEDLIYKEAGSPIRPVRTTYYGEAILSYNREFEKHNITGLLVGIMRQYIDGASQSLHTSLPSRNLGLSGRFTYAYDSRYFTEFNFGYNGSERFYKDERFGFFPSVGGGWIVSNEKFWKVKKINKLKLKATYGLVGNDQIGAPSDRFFYLSEVNLRGPGSSIWFGENFTENMGTSSVSRYPNKYITWEIAKKSNFGVELGLLNSIEIQADYFTENRSKIFYRRSSSNVIPSQNGYAADLFANVGKAKSNGFEVQADGNLAFKNGMWMTLRGNFTYATSQYTYFEEPNLPEPYLSVMGYNVSQHRGLIAERLFIDDADIANSPKQSFGEYMPGDIKYRDVNNDGVVDDNDVVPIGHPGTPEIMYGFGASLGYKGFDLSFFFQGAGRTSFFINPAATSPFVNMGDGKVSGDQAGIYGGRVTNNSMLQAWADSYWSESNRDSYAAWPRLSDTPVDNNLRSSTWFLRDGAYLRLKSVEIGYTLPQKTLKFLGIKTLRLYASGLNLLTFSKFKLWDVEQGGEGLSYPIQQVYNVGININF